VLQEKVVGEAIAVRLGYSDALARGAIHECDLCEFAHAAGTKIPGGHIFFSFHEVRPRNAEIFAVVKQERAGKIKGAEEIRAFLGPIFRIAKRVVVLCQI
jgi:hypothetical protein